MKNPGALRDWLVGHRITSAFFTTLLAELPPALDWPADTALRLLMTGGDRLRRWAPEGAPYRLVTVYGPTENTVVSTWAHVPAQPGRAGAPPIGRPVPGTWAPVLDDRRRSGRGASCTWAARSSRRATWPGPRRTGTGTSRRPRAVARRPEAGRTARATRRAGARTDNWSAWAGPTGR